MSSSSVSARGNGPRQRRRPRGSLERPVNARLYRSSFLLVSLPLLILAFSIARPLPLPAPLLPPNFDGAATLDLATDCRSGSPIARPGTGLAAGRAVVRDQLKPYGLPVSTDRVEDGAGARPRARCRTSGRSCGASPRTRSS